MLRQLIFSMTLTEDESGIGERIAKRLKIIFNGIQDSEFGKFFAFVFTDPETKSTFYATNEKEAEKRLKDMRVRFGYA